jgi:uncharacterized protein (TIGR02594 family)
MKKLIFLLTVMLVSFSFVSVSEARPKHKNYHYSKVHKHTHKKVRKVKKVVLVQQVQLPNSSDEENTSTYWINEKARMAGVQNVVVEASRRSFRTVENTIIYSGDLANKASRYIGLNASQLGLPSRLWCADFMNMLVGGTDRRAISYVHRGKPAAHGCTNCIAVTKRKGGNHVGIVTGYDGQGNPILLSGNNQRRVGVARYARYKVIAYRYI